MIVKKIIQYDIPFILTNFTIIPSTRVSWNTWNNFLHFYYNKNCMLFQVFQLTPVNGNYKMFFYSTFYIYIFGDQNWVYGINFLFNDFDF